MEQRIKVIFNPAANRGKAAVLLPRLQRYLERHGTFDLAQTTKPGEATALTIQALTQGFNVITAAGGDGTVNEVVNGLLTAQNNGAIGTLGVIPTGSGNDFAYGIGIAQDLETACTRVFVGERRLVDIGHIEDEKQRSRYFDNGVGIGFDAAVALEVRKIHRVGGFLMYLLGVMRTLAFYYKAPLLTVRFDGKEISQETLMLTVSNGRRHGGGFHITPDASMDDGLLDLCIAARMGRLAILQMIPRLVRGSHVGDSRIQMERGQHFIVEVPDGLAVHLDGEIFAECAHRLEIRVLPRQLYTIV